MKITQHAYQFERIKTKYIPSDIFENEGKIFKKFF